MAGAVIEPVTQNVFGAPEIRTSVLCDRKTRSKPCNELQERAARS